MKKNILLIIFIISFTGLVLFTGAHRALSVNVAPSATESASFRVKKMEQEILVVGTLESEAQATMRFSVGGKLIYLPFKEGDRVRKGQTIAQLDTYDLRKRLEIAVNNLRLSKDTLSQSQENQRTHLMEVQLRYNVESVTKLYGSIQEDETTVLSNMAARIIDQNQANAGSVQAQVDLANSAFQLSTITSPIDGIVLHEDITTVGVNVTPATSFVVVDPSQLIFHANVLESDIDFVKTGTNVSVKLDNKPSKIIKGTVLRVYPEKTKSASGTNVYRVDVESPEFKLGYTYGLSGAASIDSLVSGDAFLVPTWTIISGRQIWVVEGGKPQFKEVSVGNSRDGKTVILSGLSDSDEIVNDPEFLVAKLYWIL